MNTNAAEFREMNVWASESSELDPLSIAFLQKYLDTLSLGDSVLDIGCGQGKLVRFLRDRGIAVLGVDLNAELVEIALSAGLPVKLVDAVTAMKTEASAFTVFSMLDFVEHTPVDAIVEILSVISEKPGAMIWLQTPNLDSLMGLKFWFHMPSHVTALHPVVLRKLLTRFNFEIVAEWSDFGGLPWTGLRRKIALKILNALFGSPIANMFLGGGNICLVAKVKLSKPGAHSDEVRPS